MASKKASNVKPSKSRPVATSAISQPALLETLPILSSFSTDGNLFALVTLAVDKHRLRIYNSVSGRAIAEHTVQEGRVSSLVWATAALSSGPSAETNSPTKRRKKRRAENDTEKEERKTEAEVVLLGISDGTILLYSPEQSKIVRTLSHGSSTSPILALAPGVSNKSNLWTSSADSSTHLWDVQKNTIIRSWKNEDRIPFTSLAVQQPTNPDNPTHLLAAHHHIRLLTDVSSPQDPSLTKPTQVATFTGHASSINILRWAKATATSHRFFSAAEGDRFVYLWESEGASINEKPVASIPLDSDVRSVSLNSSDPSRQVLMALSTSGKLSFIPIPSEFPSSSNSGDEIHKIHTLLPRSTLTGVSKTNSDPPIINVVPISAVSGSIRVARLVQGIKPVFDLVVSYLVFFRSRLDF